jgi:biopolymer transport protein ExbD
MPLKAFDPADEPEINMTPMIDCVFLLLIFFMVGTKFIDQERDVEVKLPNAAASAPLTSGPDDLVVNVVGQGTVVVSGESMSLEQLEEHLRSAKKNYADQGVLVRGSGPDPYQLVMDVLDVCERSQISKVSLAHRVREPK